MHLTPLQQGLRVELYRVVSYIHMSGANVGIASLSSIIISGLIETYVEGHWLIISTSAYQGSVI